MLQQILKDMYIDPELLAELDETQKQTLFCRMREEQVKRWRIWDKKEVESAKNHPQVPRRNSCKSVQWLLDEEGEPLVAIIGEQNYNDDIRNVINQVNDHLLSTVVSKDTDNDDDTVMMENNNNELRIPMEQDCVNCDNQNLLNSKPNDTDLYSKLQSKNKPYSRIPSIAFKFHDKRGALQELSLNKVQNVAKRVAEWEQRVTENNNSPPTSTKSSPVGKKEQEPELVSEIEEQEDQIWREQEKKAKEAEIRMRTIARCAREEHRRSLIEMNYEESGKLSASNYSQVSIISNKVSIGSTDMRNKPLSKESVIQWFKRREVARGAGFNLETNLPHPWFHGLITRQEAEALLTDKTIGTFLVRISDKIWGYTISYKDTYCCKHYLIDASNGQYRFLGTDGVSHKTLNELIKYHSLRPITVTGGEILCHPCQMNKNLSDIFATSV